MHKFFNVYVVVACCLFCSSFQTKTATGPNVIIINMDDMGYGDTEPYGLTGFTTPNFNRLAKEGLRFTQFYSAQAVCSPSRAALLTGCYPNRIGMSGGALMPWTKYALNPKEETIATLLKRAGYKTCMLGKWHLGSIAPYLPLQYGFDSFYGIPYSADMWPVDYDGNAITDTALWKSRYPALPVYDGNKKVASINNLVQQGMVTQTLTRRATDFIKENKKAPFFLYLAHPQPHVPLAASPSFIGKTSYGLFGDVISEIDWSIGEVLNTLEVNNLSKNTLLIVTSDNGPWIVFGDHAGSTGGLREGKGTAWDGGTRVPCYIRWPGHVEAGGVCSQLLAQMDLLPTIVAATGCNMPREKIDGLNFLDLLTGKSTISPRQLYFSYYDKNNLKIARYKNWELVLPHAGLSYEKGVHGKDAKPGTTPTVQVPLALYNLTSDPGTVYDVQSLYPNVVKEIMRFVEDMRNDLGDDLVGKKPLKVRPAALIQ